MFHPRSCESPDVSPFRGEGKPRPKPLTLRGAAPSHAHPLAPSAAAPALPPPCLPGRSHRTVLRSLPPTGCPPPGACPRCPAASRSALPSLGSHTSQPPATATPRIRPLPWVLPGLGPFSRWRKGWRSCLFCSLTCPQRLDWCLARGIKICCPATVRSLDTQEPCPGTVWELAVSAPAPLAQRFRGPRWPTGWCGKRKGRFSGCKSLPGHPRTGASPRAHAADLK